MAPDETLRQVVRWLEDAIPEGVVVRERTTVSLPEGEIVPDVTVAYGTAEEDALPPIPDTIALLVEILAPDDRRDRIAVYARAEVPEVWILDPIARRLEVHREPTPDGYAVTTILREGKRIAPRLLRMPEILVFALLPNP